MQLSLLNPENIFSFTFNHACHPNIHMFHQIPYHHRLDILSTKKKTLSSGKTTFPLYHLKTLLKLSIRKCIILSALFSNLTKNYAYLCKKKKKVEKKGVAICAISKTEKKPI